MPLQSCHGTSSYSVAANTLARLGDLRVLFCRALLFWHLLADVRQEPLTVINFFTGQEMSLLSWLCSVTISELFPISFVSISLGIRKILFARTKQNFSKGSSRLSVPSVLSTHLSLASINSFYLVVFSIFLAKYIGNGFFLWHRLRCCLLRTEQRTRLFETLVGTGTAYL